MLHRVRSTVLGLWHILKYDNSISFRGGYLFVRTSLVNAGDSKNGIFRIPMSRKGDA